MKFIYIYIRREGKVMQSTLENFYMQTKIRKCWILQIFIPDRLDPDLFICKNKKTPKPWKNFNIGETHNELKKKEGQLTNKDKEIASLQGNIAESGSDYQVRKKAGSLVKLKRFYPRKK